MLLNDMGIHYCKQIQTTNIKHEAGNIDIETPSGGIKIVAADTLCLMSPNIIVKGISINMKCDLILDGSLKVQGEMSFSKLKTDAVESSSLTINGHSMLQTLDVNGDLDIGGGSCSVSGNVQLCSPNNSIIFGDGFDDSWRITIVNGDLHFQKHKQGKWLTLTQWGDVPSP